MRWRSEKIYFDGDTFFEGLIEDIRQARETITFEMYIFDKDRLGRLVAEALQAAAARGVHVRVMVDGVGSPDWRQDFMDSLAAAGVESRIFHPLPWIVFSRFRQLFSKINRRNHRKVCVIDGKAAWVGSFNVTEVHCRKHCGEKTWRDTGIRIEGSAIEVLRWAFERAWAVSWYPGRRRRLTQALKRLAASRVHAGAGPSGLIRLNYSGKLRRIYRERLVRRIELARRHVKITNAYFVPIRAVRVALRRTAQRGVDVQLLVPGISDHYFVYLASAASYAQLLKAGVRIFEYQRTMLHAKTMTVDDSGAVGSSNMNHRSLMHDLEVDVILTHHESKRGLIEQFETDLKQAREVTLTNWKSRPLGERLLAGFLWRFRYWL